MSDNPKRRDMKRLAWVAAGTLAVILGAIGMFVPVLPTTPFLLLAAFCYARGSQRFHHWLLNNRWFGTYIKNYREGRGMTLRLKALTLAALWLTIGLTALYAVPVWWGRLLLFGVAVGVTAHLIRIKTCKTQGAAQRASDPLPAEKSALACDSSIGDQLEP